MMKEMETKLANKTILLVEDDMVLCKMYKKALEIAGANVLVSANGQDALVQLWRERVDLILLDLMMPLMNGYETIRQIKSNERTCHIPIIVLTNLDEHPEFIEKATGAKLEEYLVKSNVTIDEVIEKIGKHVAK